MSDRFRAVAFDLGGVLVDVDHGRAARSIAVSPVDWERALFAGDAHDRLSRGRAQPSELFEPASRALRRDPVDVQRAWAGVVRVWEEAPELVARVRATGRRVLVWSNTDPVHAAEMARALPVVADARGLSFLVGAMKPEAEYYQRALDPDLSFSEVLFLDDRHDNVRAAQALGIEARLIERGIHSVRAALRDVLGVEFA